MTKDQSAPQSSHLRYPLQFRFCLCGAQFETRVTKQSGGIHLHLQGTVADVPFSIEGSDDRAAILKTIAEKGSASSWVITPNQRLALNTEFFLTGRPSFARFFAEALRAAIAHTPATAIA